MQLAARAALAEAIDLFERLGMRRELAEPAQNWPTWRLAQVTGNR